MRSVRQAPLPESGGLSHRMLKRRKGKGYAPFVYRSEHYSPPKYRLVLHRRNAPCGMSQERGDSGFPGKFGNRAVNADV